MVNRCFAWILLRKNYRTGISGFTGLDFQFPSHLDSRRFWPQLSIELPKMFKPVFANDSGAAYAAFVRFRRPPNG